MKKQVIAVSGPTIGLAMAIAVMAVTAIVLPPLAAADTQSRWKSEAANGITYKFCSVLSKTGSTIKAEAIIKASTGIKTNNAMQIKARLYYNKSLTSESIWHKGNKGSTIVTASTPSVTRKGTGYRSRSLVRLYNGKGYDTYSAKWSPASKKALSRFPIHPYPTTTFNGRVMTYGTDFDAPTPEDAPDLVSATAENGASGYVLSEDINSVPDTPAEAFVQDVEASTKPIFVYSLSGEPVGTLSTE